MTNWQAYGRKIINSRKLLQTQPLAKIPCKDLTSMFILRANERPEAKRVTAWLERKAARATNLLRSKAMTKSERSHRDANDSSHNSQAHMGESSKILERFKFRLASVWICCFVVAILLVISLTIVDNLLADKWPTVVTLLLEIYGPYLGLVIGASVGSRSSKSIERERPGPYFLIAVVGTILWNLIVLLPIFRLIWTDGSLTGVLKADIFVGGTWSPLVALALGLYFAHTPKGK